MSNEPFFASVGIRGFASLDPRAIFVSTRSRHTRFKSREGPTF